MTLTTGRKQSTSVKETEQEFPSEQPESSISRTLNPNQHLKKTIHKLDFLSAPPISEQ